MKFIRAVFFPFSVLYGWLMQARNKQFDNGQRSQTEFDRVVISVGNLSVGGTGKTPMIEFLIKYLKNRVRLATISRGFGRRTKGFRIVTDEDSAATIGDEPLQFHRKFGQEVKVSVCEERILAIPSLLMENEEIEVFLLDDAFQHRKAGRDFDIMLSDYSHPFYKDYVLPTGNLREPRSGAGRADAVIITKCPPSISDQTKKEITAEIRKYNDHAPVYFSTIKYLPVKPVFEEVEVPKQVVLLTGIAKPQPVVDYLGQEFEIQKHIEYADHYNFREKDITNIVKEIKSLGLKSLITTEKDMVRLLPFKSHSIFKEIDLFYLPIEFELDRKDAFESQVMKVIEKGKR